MNASTVAGYDTRLKPILTTFEWPRPTWLAQADVVAPAPARQVIREVLARARSHAVVVLNGSLHRDQAIALMLSRSRKPPRIVILDATWKLPSGPFDRAAMKVGIRLIDGPHVNYCVLSNFERNSFPQTWGVDRQSVAVTLWPHTLTDAELNAPTDDTENVVGLGDSLRDYRALLEVAPELSAPVTIASRTLGHDIQRANTTAGPVSARRYDELLHRASIIVVPLVARQDRSAGQTTYVNAMALGKVVVVTDTPGVRDYITHGETGVIVPPDDAAALAKSLEYLLAHPSERRAIGQRARKDALRRLTPDRYVETVLDVVTYGAGVKR